MSMMDLPASQTAESNLWDGIHSPSKVYSPPAPPRPYRMGLGHSSPMSNLALDPRFRSPGDDYPAQDSVRTDEQHADQSSAQSFDESNFGESHMCDIHAQHAGLQGSEIHNGNAECPQGAALESANGPTEDQLGAYQAMPVEDSPKPQQYEGA